MWKAPPYYGCARNRVELKTAYHPENSRKEILEAKRKKIPSEKKGGGREICGTNKTAYRPETPRKEILGAKRKKVPSEKGGLGGRYAELIIR